MSEIAYGDLAQNLLAQLNQSASTEQQRATLERFLIDQLGQRDERIYLAGRSRQYTPETLMTLRQALQRLQQEGRLVRATNAMIPFAGVVAASEQRFLPAGQAIDLFRQRSGAIYSDALGWEGYIEGEQMPDVAGIYLFHHGKAYRAFDILPVPGQRLEGALDQAARWEVEKVARATYESLHSSVIGGPDGWDLTVEQIEEIRYTDDSYLAVLSVTSEITQYGPGTEQWLVAAFVCVGFDLEPERYTVARAADGRWIVEKC